MTKCATRDLLRAVLPVLSKKPAASMDEIADAVHLGRATLFRRFGSRDGLIRALMLESYAIGREIMEPLLTMVEEMVESGPRTIRSWPGPTPPTVEPGRNC